MYFTGLRDESERVREISAEVILFIFNHMVNSSPMTLSYVIPALKQRLYHQPGEEIVEPCEEVRLILLKIVDRILQLSGPESSQDMKLHLDDLILILSCCIEDNFAGKSNFISSSEITEWKFLSLRFYVKICHN